VVCGSAGEGVLLSADEKVTVWEMVVRYAAPEKVLIAGTAAESVRETVGLTNRAAELGYKAALVGTPHYYKGLMSLPETHLLYYRAVADHSRMPLIISNCPQTAGIDIAAGTVATLSEHPNIAGIHENSGNLENVMTLLREVRPGFPVLVGSAALWPFLLMGASGAVLPFANAAPYAAILIWEAYRTRDEEAARDWQNRIARAAALVTSKYGVPGLKHAMDLNGYYGGPPRLPLSVISTSAKAEIEDAFRDLKS